MSRRVCGPPANTRIDTPRTSRSTSSNGPPGAVNRAVSRAFSVSSACPPAAVRGVVGSALTTAASPSSDGFGRYERGSGRVNGRAHATAPVPGRVPAPSPCDRAVVRSGLLGLGADTGLGVERPHLGLDPPLVLERVLTRLARAPPPGHQEHERDEHELGREAHPPPGGPLARALLAGRLDLRAVLLEERQVLLRHRPDGLQPLSGRRRVHAELAADLADRRGPGR